MERKAPIIKEKIIMAKKILVVVDAQNDFITGALGSFIALYKFISPDKLQYVLVLY